MSKEYTTRSSTLHRLTTNQDEAWKGYWQSQGQPWRTEPEIDAQRQRYLAERRALEPDIENGIYPFKDIKLSRADVEWLLATHENGRGPVDWNDQRQRGREGIDVRGADLRQVDLSYLPLARVHAGLDQEAWYKTSKGQRNMAAAWMNSADFTGAHLEEARLRRVHLEDAFLWEAHLEKADLFSAHLEGTNLYYAHLDGASLRLAFLDAATYLKGASLGNKKLGYVSLADIRWGNSNLAVVKWSQLGMLGEEEKACQKGRDGKRKDLATQLHEYEEAVRANRQLAVVLQGQGLNEHAAYFAYRAQNLQRVVLRHQRKFVGYLFSGMLDLLAGYGYRPGRSVLWYVLIIFGFTVAYFAVGHLPFLPDALVFSLTSFHGRGFFPGLGSEASLHNPLIVMAAVEAVLGLFIEISFIATFTKRFYNS